jgi:hypothetical protein
MIEVLYYILADNLLCLISNEFLLSAVFDF